MTGRRTLAVEIEDLAIEDGAIPPPRLGSVIGLPLRFGETSPAAAGAVTIRALLEPATTAPRRQYTGPDTPGRWQWQGLLRGDGWTATWRSFRPLTGQVELTGRFRAVLGDDTGEVRGLVTRIQIVTERFHSTPDTRHWEVLHGSRRLRDVDAAPRFFDRGTMLEQDGGEADRDISVLVTLDLDDVPEVPTRPRIVPGAVSAGGALLWVIDRELPLLVSIDADRKAREHILPGAIGPSRRIWATPAGCWIADPAGLFRCDNDDGPLEVGDLPVTAAAVLGESLFACHESGRWTLHRPDSDPIQIKAPDGRIVLCTSDTDSVVVAVSNADGIRLARIDQTGDVFVGPVLPALPTTRRRFLTGGPLRLLSDDRAVGVEPCLTLGEAHRLPRDFLSAGQVGPYVWGVHHPADETARNGGFPLPVPDTYTGTRRQFWMFTLLDGHTLEPVSSTPVYTTRPSVTIDDAGTVWITADGVRSIPAISMQWPPVLDVAALLDHAVAPRNGRAEVSDSCG